MRKFTASEEMENEAEARENNKVSKKYNKNEDNKDDSIIRKVEFEKFYKWLKHYYLGDAFDYNFNDWNKWVKKRGPK